jgi:hypothetical protein
MNDEINFLPSVAQWPAGRGHVKVVLSGLKNPSKSPFTKGDFLFSFAEYLAACCEDEGEENPP